MASHSIQFLPATPSRPVLGEMRQVWSVVRSMARARATRRLLADMDGRMLADIGVTRSQADVEVSRPFWDHGAR